MWGYVRLGVLSRLLRPLIKYTTYNTLQIKHRVEDVSVKSMLPRMLSLIYLIPRAGNLLFTDEFVWSRTRAEARIEVSFLFGYVAYWHFVRKHFL